MDIAAEIKKIVDKMTRQIVRDAGRAQKLARGYRAATPAEQRDGRWSTVPVVGGRRSRAKRTGPARKRSGRKCRGCGSAKHDMRNCEKVGAAHGKR